MTAPLPTGFRLTLDVSAKQLTDDLWFGGTPPRVVRLTPAGRQAWTRLRRHSPVTTRAEGRLARHLTDIGIAHPVPPAVPPATATDDVTVVIPVRDRAAQLAGCLRGLDPQLSVVVVDDGSADGEAIEHVCAGHGARLVRHDVNAGPAAARNTGLAEVHTPYVAFVDSDCEPAADWLSGLRGHLDDPLVAAVAPRIRGRSDDSWSGRYTRVRASLDLGGLPARVRPGSRVSYVPTAAVVARVDVLREVGGFDEALRVGEDVDLVWRLHENGRRVRYEPSVEVAHREPAGWPALLRRRFSYGTSAGELARRHPGAMPPLVLHPWPTVTVVGLLARRPLVAAVGFAAAVTATARTLRRADVPTGGLLPATARAVHQTWLGLGRYGTQLAAPLLLAGLLPRRSRLAAASLLLGPPLGAWAAHRRSLDPVRFVTGAVADDIAYGAGVWAGCARARTTVPVRPAVTWRPVRTDARRS